jgi:hypothetical protein
MKNKLLTLLLLSNILFAGSVTFQGKKTGLSSDVLSIGNKAPTFLVVKNNLPEIVIGGIIYE